MKRVLGGFILLMGIVLAGWVAFNLLVVRLPETQGRSPVRPLLAAAAFIYVGIRWLRREA